MSSEDKGLTIVGVAFALVLVALILSAGSCESGRNKEYSAQAKACIQSGGSWVTGNCIRHDPR